MQIAQGEPGILVHDLVTEGGDKPLKLANVAGGKAASHEPHPVRFGPRCRRA